MKEHEGDNRMQCGRMYAYFCVDVAEEQEHCAEIAREYAVPEERTYIDVYSASEERTEYEKLRAVLAALPEAEVWLTDDSAERAARSAYTDPDSLPLLVLCDRPRHIIHACAGYRVGSVDTALAFCRKERTNLHRTRQNP